MNEENCNLMINIALMVKNDMVATHHQADNKINLFLNSSSYFWVFLRKLNAPNGICISKDCFRGFTI